jgi:hypothetical protein
MEHDDGTYEITKPGVDIPVLSGIQKTVDKADTLRPKDNRW